MRFALIVALAVSLAGCMVGPDYRRPTVDAPQAFRYQETDAAGAANAAWWKQFDDPVLDGLIAEALAGNKDVKIAAAKIEQASGYLTQTRAPLFPQLGYNAGGGRQRSSELEAAPWNPSAPNPQTSFQLIGGASWELDLWGRIRRLSESAQADLMASEEARRGVILTLVSSVASNYLNLRGLDEQLAISKRTLSVYGESVKLFELQFQYGQTSQMTVEQARTQYETAAAKIPQIEAQIARTENTLSILLGRNPGPVARGKSLRELQFPKVPAGVPSQLLANRPDILQAEQGLIAANAQIGAARALYFPTISLTGNLGVSSGELHNLFKGAAKVWSYSGSITGPIFTAGAISGQVEQARAAHQAALLGYEQAIQNAFADVENAFVSKEMLAEELKAQERLVRASGEYERLAKLQFDGGYSPYSTVLQAEQQLFPAELALAQVRTSLFGSYVTIYKAMGGGWVATAEQLTHPAEGEKTLSLRPCADELERFCKAVPPGLGQTMVCLDRYREELSPVCREKVSRAMDKLEKARQECAGDIAAFCPEVQPGGGRLLDCLKKKADSLSPTCRAQVQRYTVPPVPRPAAK